jgi:hypothetical protein
MMRPPGTSDDIGGEPAFSGMLRRVSSAGAKQGHVDAALSFAEQAKDQLDNDIAEILFDSGDAPDPSRFIEKAKAAGAEPKGQQFLLDIGGKDVITEEAYWLFLAALNVEPSEGGPDSPLHQAIFESSLDPQQKGLLAQIAQQEKNFGAMTADEIRSYFGTKLGLLNQRLSSNRSMMSELAADITPIGRFARLVREGFRRGAESLGQEGVQETLPAETGTEPAGAAETTAEPALPRSSGRPVAERDAELEFSVRDQRVLDIKLPGTYEYADVGTRLAMPEGDTVAAEVFETGRPLGFRTSENFLQFKTEISKGLIRVGASDAQAGLVGSSVTGASHDPAAQGHTGDFFDETIEGDAFKQSDHDIAIVSGKLFEKALRVMGRAGADIEHTGLLSTNVVRRLGLERMLSNLRELTGRNNTRIVIYRDTGALARRGTHMLFE